MADVFTKIEWGDGFTVTDEGAGVIRVDALPPTVLAAAPDEPAPEED